jgi:DNA polymerase-3 subunit epsilon
VTWRREQADSLRAYFDKNGIEHDGVDPGWPVHTSLQQLAGVA